MVNQVRTLDFLPEVFRTETNKQFLSATLDVLTSQPEFDRVEGFIGNKYGYAVQGTDRYVVEPTKTRADYQLSPSLVYLKKDTQTAKDFIDYPGIMSALKNRGAATENPNDLFANEFYSWDSFADLDKIVNYSQYYWLPLGPDAISITTALTSDSVTMTDVIGKQNYTSPNGVTFINGLKVIFNCTTVPSSYESIEYYVEGVGTAITLIPTNDLIAVENIGEGIYNPWGSDPWDSTGWSVNLYVPVTPDYLTINRNSRDRNAWSRGNRWFSQNVINTTTQFNGQVTTNEANVQTRARRPIIEFYGNLSLWDSGNISAGFVSFIDTTTTDPMTSIVGAAICTINASTPSISVVAQDGARVVFADAADETVRQTVYVVNYVPAGTSGATVVALTPVPGVTIVDGTQLYVISGPSTYSGTAWRWSLTDGEFGNTIGWAQSQKKTQVNQAPLFDIFNLNGVSIGKQTASTFAGTKLFSYAPGTGANDAVLGFPISYSSVANLGDINFDVNLNGDTYQYTSGTTTVTALISTGFVHYSPVYGTIEKKIGWVKAAAESVQYQVFSFTLDELSITGVECDVLVDSTSVWTTTQVYLDGNFQDTDSYTVTTDATYNTTTISLDELPFAGQEIVVLLLSKQTSPTAYYTIPANLQNNPFNTNITEVSVGDMRNHYSSIFTNAPGITGQQFGLNNYENLGDLTPYGTSIIQSSASLALPMAFIRRPGYNIGDALQYSSTEYIDYKNTIVDIAYREDYSVYQSPADILDNIIYKISSSKSETGSFFWSDMLPSGSVYAVNSYNFNAGVTSAICPLSRTYDFTSANYYGVLVYLTRTVNQRVTYTQLVIGVDYTVSTNSPSLTVNYNILAGDKITVKEYNQTYGSYIPNTPTKLGLYQATIPGVITDSTYTTPTQFIVGHDGSYNKLYGNYTAGQLDDFRDIALLEFETRIYNNLKWSGAIPLTYTDLFPGEFRTTSYTRADIMPAYSECFLNWVGTNRIDYKTQVYSQGNQFTYNYNKSGDKLQGVAANATTPIQQGYWRGIYRWFYDTTNPAGTPWEMLGFTEQPSWWTARYGAAPYTSGNTLMWQDLADGRVWNNGAPYIEPTRVRPQLLSVLPVDAQGVLVSPFNSVLGNFDPLTFKRGWVVGDEGPAESSYLKSSSWPFDLMKLLSTFKPAKFYNLFADRDLYKYDSDLDQYLFNNRYHLVPNELTIYGSGTSKNSYINWIVDYLNQVGTDGSTDVTDTLDNIDVRLTYRLAGFSDKQYLKFLIEHSTPSSYTPRLLIPDDSFDILLYDNVPEDKIIYSSVIVQKTTLGWTVWGNSINNPYFDITDPTPGPKEKIVVGSTLVELSTTYNQTSSTLVAYGTEFYSIQGVSEFMRNYGRRQVEQGVQFQNITDGTLINWTEMIREFMAWASQGWETGSTISLNPNATLFNVYRPGLVVQPLTLQQDNFVLNQNLMPLQPQNMAVLRNNEEFSIKVLSVGDTVAYTNLNLSSIEHAIVFNNVTTFNDTIYQLTTGLRQNRVVMTGSKTALWTGYINANGFILNEGDVQEWNQNGKYPKGQIVTYKNNYWSANILSEPQEIFNYNQWTQVNYDQVKQGILPNPSTAAYEATKFYDINQANLDQDQDLLAFGLIGFRPRQYMVDAELSDISQVNVYINMIPQKGTNLIANAFKNATLTQGKVDYDVRENWAIKNGDFGGVLNSNFVEFLLSQTDLTGNPGIVGFSSSTVTPTGVNQTVNISNLINYGRAPTSANFLPVYANDYTDERGLPTAGYVNLNDVKFTAYSYEDLNLTPGAVATLYTSDYVWVANYRGSWAVFQPESVGTTVVSISNNLNGTINVTFEGPHNLAQNDPFVISDFDDVINGFFTVGTAVSLNTVTVSSDLSKSIVSLSGQGIALKLVTRRFEQASDITNIQGTQFATRLAWVDADTTGEWEVKAAGPVYQDQVTQTRPSLGSSVAYTSSIGYLALDGAGKLYRNGVDTGLVAGTDTPGSNPSSIPYAIAQLVAFGNYVYCTDPNPDTIAVYCYTFNGTSLALTETINAGSNTGAIAVSQDRKWMYVSDYASSSVNVFMLGAAGANLYGSTPVYTLTGPASQSFGTSLATSIDGSKLIVGAPTKQETINSILENNVGAAYIYSRASESFSASGTTYTVSQTTGGQALAYVDSVLVSTASVVGTTVILTTAPPSGSIVVIDYGTLTLQQTLASAAPHDEALFGNSVTTSRYGADMFVGIPYEFNYADNTEGAVYRYTNVGQQFGTVTCTPVLPVASTRTIFIDGFKIVINSLLSTTLTPSVLVAGTSYTVAAVCSSIHGLTTGSLATIQGAAQTPYNGSFVVNVTSPTTFTYVVVTTTSLTFESSANTAISSASQIAGIINADEPTNVIASAVGTTLTISTVSGTSNTPGDIVDIVGATVADLTALGIVTYANTQKIYNPDGGVYTSFGWTIAANQETSLRDSLVVGAWTGTALGDTTFDFTDDLIDDDTIFDNDATSFIDSFPKVGAVYQFDYLPASTNSVTTPGKYVFGQYCNTVDSTGISDSPQYGIALAFNDGAIVVGSSTWYANGNGRVDGYVATTQTSSWYTYRKSALQVDVNRINNIGIYDTITNTDLEFLDYIDPVQGKMLSAVETNIDIISSTDPASYTTGVVWGAKQVGKTWLDTTNLRMMNYNQASATQVADNLYNSRYWGVAFPGSTADIYTWVVSTVAPINYSGIGFVVDFDKYASGQSLDPATDSLVTEYYFWVKNYTVVPDGKNLSPSVLSQYILNPAGSGVAFMAALTTNAVALYNCKDSIQSNSSALHLGYSAAANGSPIHQDWSLIQDGTYDSFLVGVPATISESPTGMYLKYLNSFMGAEVVGTNLLAVPDTALPELVKYGTQFRPRQSMFVDRAIALQNYIDYANAVLIKFPITETRGTTFLNQTGTVPTNYDVSDYWSLTNWWATGYSDNTKIIIEVPTYTDLTTLGQASLYDGSEGLFLTLQPGLIARVAKNGQGLSEVYVYQDTTVGWVRIGLQNGTIQINTSLYTTTSPIPSIEIYYIVRWLTEQVYTNELEIENNNTLMLMFNLIQSQSIEQNNYLPWLNKTSLIDVSNVIRALKPYTKFQRDNQELVSGYLTEIKPFHVYIKSYALKYNGSDTYAMDFTDFDLPAKYNSTLATFSSPQLIYEGTPGAGQYLPTSAVWAEAEYTQWYNHYGLTLSNSEVEYLPVTKLVQDNLNTTTLTALTTSSTTLKLANVLAIPSTGTVVVNSQSLAYTAVNYFSNTLTLAAAPTLAHAIGSIAIVLLPVLSASTYTLIVQNAAPLPNTGVILIGTELISYTELNRATGVLTNVIRGENGTVAADHSATADVYIQTSPVNVMSPGRGYTDQPTITAAIDTNSNIAVWQSGTAYVIGNVVANNKVVYTCSTANTDTVFNSVNWTVTTVYTVLPWQASVSYGVTDKVVYNSVGFSCIIDNNDASFNGLNWAQIPLYPAPRTAATFTANMSNTANDQLASVTVTNPGNGYAVLPRFIVEPTTITASWTSVDVDDTDIDLVTNQIYITAHPFQTGDSVAFTGVSKVKFPLLPGNYYYVKSINANTIALYYTYEDAINGWSTASPASATITSIAGAELTMSNSNFVTGSQVKIVIGTQFYNYYAGRVDLDPVNSNVICLYDTLADAQADTNRVTTTAAVGNTITNVQATDTTRINLVKYNSGTLTVTATVTAYTNEQPVREMKIGMKFDRTSYTYDAADTNAIWRIQNQYSPTINMPGFGLDDYDQLMSGTTYPNVRLLDPAFTYGKTYVFTTSNVSTGANTIVLNEADYSPTYTAGTPPIRTVEAIITPSPAVSVAFATPVQMLFVASPLDTVYSTTFGLTNRNSYWFKAVSATEVSAYNTENDAINDVNRVALTSQSQGQLIVGTYDGVVINDNASAIEYNIEGGIFAEGYGPEELMPGVITDTINMTVTSKPGSTWDPTTLAVGDANSTNLAHTGFNMTRFSATPSTLTLKDGSTLANAIDFSGQVPNPVAITLYASGSLYYVGALSGAQRRVDQADFTIDWINQTIVVTNATINTTQLDVVLYEFGNGNQLIRSNSTIYPMTSIAGLVPHTEILLDAPYASQTFVKNGITYNVMGVTLPTATNYWETVAVYTNGEKLQYNDPLYPVTPGYTPPTIKYTIQPQRTYDPVNDPYNPAKIVFDGLYDPAVDYISFVVSSDYSGISGISIPETQWFTGKSGVGVTLDLNGFLGDQNLVPPSADNIILEINGQRYDGSAPTIVQFVADINTLAYPAPVYSLSDFDPLNLIVKVNGATVPSSNTTWLNNYDSATLLPGVFDADFGLLFGYLDDGTPFDSTTMLSVTFEASYLASIVGQTITIEYDAASVPEVFSVTANVGLVGGVLTLLAPVVASDVIAVTTFNRTTQQSLVTQAISDATVSLISGVVELTGSPVSVTTLDNHNLEPGDYVTINGTAAPDLDGNNYYVNRINLYTVTLYSDAALTTPVVLFNTAPLIPGQQSYIQVINVNETPSLPTPLAINQPLYDLYNEDRLWVTIIRDTVLPNLRDYVAPTRLRIVNNTLVILEEILPSDVIIVTSMVPSASPDETKFRISLDKYNGITGQIPVVYRENQQTRTYLTATMTTTLQPSDQFTVADPYKLVDTITYADTPTGNEVQMAAPVGNYIEISGIISAQVTSVTVTAVTAYTNFTVTVVNNNTIRVECATAGDATAVTKIQVAIGNTVMIQGEQIGFAGIDLTTGVVSGLRRGLNGTITNVTLDKNSTAQSVLISNELSKGYYDLDWYGQGIDYTTTAIVTAETAGTYTFSLTANPTLAFIVATDRISFNAGVTVYEIATSYQSGSNWIITILAAPTVALGATATFYYTNTISLQFTDTLQANFLNVAA